MANVGSPTRGAARPSARVLPAAAGAVGNVDSPAAPPFSPVGMAALIASGAIIMTVAGRREHMVTVGITTAVVMVVAALDPKSAWPQPILRFADTVVGVAVGVTAAWIGATLVRLRRPAPEPERVRNGASEECYPRPFRSAPKVRMNPLPQKSTRPEGKIQGVAAK